MNPIVHMFDVANMVKPDKRLGEFPATKEVYKNFLKVAWPSAVEALLVSLVGFIDTMMVSSLGENAIAVRSKAMKCLSEVVAVDPSILARVKRNTNYSFYVTFIFKLKY